MSNNTLRILTALVGIPAIVGLLYVGSWAFALLVAAIALLAQYETFKLLEKAGLGASRGVAMVVGLCLVMAPLYPRLLFVALALVVIWLAVAPLTAARAPIDPAAGSGPAPAAGRAAGRLPATIFGIVYPAGLLAFLVALRTSRGTTVDDQTAFTLVLATFVVVWSTDTFAYYVGRAFGKRPLAPSISPKKTWAGAVGGTLGAVLVVILLKVFFLDVLTWIHAIGFALVAAVSGQLGDLTESAIKRSVAVKDSGTLLPGHGGVLDRFDAMILAAPAVYLYLAFVAGILGPGL